MEYADNIEIGTATATVTGLRNLTGSVTLEFEIARQLVSPVPDGCHFNMKTLDKPKGWTGYHDININVSESTPVYAIANGTVICSQKYTTIDGKDYLTSYGNCINFTSDEIDGKVYTAVYAHLSKISVPGVKQIIPSTDTRQQRGGSSKPLNNGKSVRVKAGDIIGYIGMTGNAGGLHLHIEIYENSKRIDPTDLFPQLKK